jgi:deoxycytidylate deaminase
VLAVGQSRLNSDPGLCDFDQIGIRKRVSLHAEEAAIKRCGNPHRATLYVARIGRNGKIALAKPCKDCRKLLTKSGIRRVFYTVDPNTYSVWTPHDEH